MRLRALIRRLAVPAAAASLAVTGLALPAQADTSDISFPLVFLGTPETVTVIDGQSKTVKFDVYNYGSAAENVVVTFGSKAKPIAADLGFVAPEGCTDGVCKLGDMAAGERRNLSFTLKPDTTSTTNLSSSFPVSATVDGEDSDATSVGVVRSAKGGIDLETGDVKDISLDRTGFKKINAEFRNTGSVDVDNIALVFAAEDALTIKAKYRNCQTESESEDGYGAVYVFCLLNEGMAPGGKYTVSSKTPVTLGVTATAAGPYEYAGIAGAIALTDKAAADFRTEIAGATGSDLELATLSSGFTVDPDVKDDLNPEDNTSLFYVSVPKSSADSAAVGAVFKGEAGDISTVKVGARNLGPTAVVPLSTTWMQTVRVRIPADLKVTKIDDMCLPGTSLDDIDYEDYSTLSGRDYVCLVMDPMAKGGKEVFSFSVEILEGDHAAGYVSVDGGVQDGNSANDKAALTVKDSGDDATLPITGAPAGMIAAGGAALLVAGFVAFRMARRRRIITIAG